MDLPAAKRSAALIGPEEAGAAGAAGAALQVLRSLDSLALS